MNAPLTPSHKRAVSATSRIATALMFAGAGVAALGVLAWVAGAGKDLPDWIIRMVMAMPPIPDWVVSLAVYKAMFVSAAGLLVAGAVTRRLAKQELAGQPLSLGAGGMPHAAARTGDEVRVQQNSGEIR
jgi:hypothetical protein